MLLGAFRGLCLARLRPYASRRERAGLGGRPQALLPRLNAAEAAGLPRSSAQPWPSSSAAPFAKGYGDADLRSLAAVAGMSARLGFTDAASAAAAAGAGLPPAPDAAGAGGHVDAQVRLLTRSTSSLRTASSASSSGGRAALRACRPRIGRGARAVRARRRQLYRAARCPDRPPSHLASETSCTIRTTRLPSRRAC